jgi:hypothetical protein
MADYVNLLLDFVTKNWTELVETWIPAYMITMGVLVFITEAFGGVRAAYGRYNTGGWGLKANIAWLLQECPAFFVPLGLLFYNRTHILDNFSRPNTNLLLLIYFMIHYFNR